MHVIRTNSDGERLVAVPDDNTESPRTWGDNLGCIAFTGHARILTDQKPEAIHASNHLRDYGYHETAEMLVEVYGASMVIPLHDDRQIVAGGQGRPDGVMFDTEQNRDLLGTPPDRVGEVMLAELAQYNTWADGDTWALVLERAVVWARVDDPSVTRTEWVAVERVGGIIGQENVEDAAAGMWTA